jgi:hypothetical protein
MVVGSITKSGIFIFDQFRDNLIIDKYEPVLDVMRAKKIDHMRSENSEDAFTWNVFRTLRQLDPVLWLPLLFASFNENLQVIEKSDSVSIDLWASKQPPASFVVPEGPTEVDIIIETNNLVWFIEAKYKSDISQKTTNTIGRDQIIRNIDVGTSYARDRKFYFSLLILEERYSAVGVKTLNKYKSDRNNISSSLPHRLHELDNLAGLSLLKWGDLSALLLHLSHSAENDYERGHALNAYKWLKDKGIEQS